MTLSSYWIVGQSLWIIRKNMGRLTLKPRNSGSLSEESQMPPGQSTSNQSPAKIMPLHKYLAVSKDQYDEFSEYLASCFALENLLFLVQAITFRHIIKGMIDENNINENKTESTRDKVFAMKFNYLEGLIKAEPTSPQSIPGIVTNIYDKYVSIEAEYQINIPYQQREKMMEFVEVNHEIQEYLSLFDEAIVEVYKMLTSVYRFQFKANSRTSLYQSV